MQIVLDDDLISVMMINGRIVEMPRGDGGSDNGGHGSDGGGGGRNTIT